MEPTQSSVDRICQEVLENVKTKMCTNRSPEHIELMVQYLAETCMQLFGEHCQLEDAAYFEMLNEAILLDGKPKQLAKWKPKITDPSGARRNVIVKNRCMFIKDAGSTFLRPLVPLSLRARLSSQDSNAWVAEYESMRREWFDQPSHMQQFMAMPKPLKPPTSSASSTSTTTRSTKADPKHLQRLALRRSIRP